MYDRGLAARLRALSVTFFELEESRMFGGLAYMMNGHICFALWDDYLVIRVGKDGASLLVEADPHARPFDLAGKETKGWVMISGDALGEDSVLQDYIDIAMLFTSTLPPKTAKRSPKKY